MPGSPLLATLGGLLVPGQASVDDAMLFAFDGDSPADLVHPAFQAQGQTWTARFSRGEDLSRRSEVRVTPTEISFYTGHISIPAGGSGYQPRVGFRDLATNQYLNHPLFKSVAITAPSGTFPLSGDANRCFVEASTPNISWRPSSTTPSPLVTMTVDRAGFERLLASASAGIEVSVSLVAISSCPNSSPPATDDGK